LKENIIAEVKTNESMKKLWKFKFIVNQIYYTMYFLFDIKYIFYKIFIEIEI